METPNHTFPWQVSGFILLTGACKSPVIKMELIVTFPVQKCLCERATVLRHTYNACLSVTLTLRYCVLLKMVSSCWKTVASLS